MDLFSGIAEYSSNPFLYSISFFLYVILNTIALPLPVELGLFNPNIHPLILVSILALARGTSALFIFEIGGIIRKKASTWTIKVYRLRMMITTLERFIKQYGYYALFILMSIPLMLDSLVLYLFSLLNKKKDSHTALARRWFISVTIAASLLRGAIILVIAEVVKIILI